ncbi:MAG: OmpA family protein, partial [Bacteroidetes bacterium]|nr:OmpA family protein [Candidatus Cryptobacteroides excrementipullorum]
FTPGATVVLTGYADAQTGSAKRNMYLSHKRAEAVAAALEEAGVEVSRIKVDYKGDTVAPYGSPEENRVVICIVGWEE